MKKILLILISFFILPVVGNAVSYCDSQTDSTIRSIVANVNVVYEINTDANGNPYFTIYVTNLGKDMLVIDTASGITYKNFGPTKTELVINTTQSGKHGFEIYSFACRAKVGSKSVTIPSYNAYYLDPLCDGLEAYKQCQKWSGYSASRSVFEKDIQEIKDTLKKIEEAKEGTKTDQFWYSKLIKVFFRVWWLLVIIVGLSIAIYYYFKNRSKKKGYDFNV